MEMEVKVLLGRLILYVDDNIHEVKMYNPNEKEDLVKGFGYIINDYVYVYKGKKKGTKKDLTMGIYKDELGKYIIVDGDLLEKRKYHIDNVVELDLNAMISYLNNNKDQFSSPEDVEVINNSTDVFAPKIDPDDDFLKQLVKQALQIKQVNLKNYKDKFSEGYALNNIKSALVKPTKTSVPAFMQWAELLGFGWEIKIFDNGTDNISPLESSIVYRSDEGISIEK
ncbi:hypothetical protein [Romboutsia ilealis]|uniref:hypothetical protein n=1 Tax=Romboutsia ilealis TaxID=1115758 RepID=UPI00272C09AF|nr:hypothetical protein [Romboutsia ilealis]